MFGQMFMSLAAIMVSLDICGVYAALSPEDKASLKTAVHEHIVECIEESGLSKEEFMEKEKKRETDPCFTSCFFKKTGIFTNEGMYNVDGAKALVRPHIKDEENLAKALAIREECVTVNDDEVSDGDKGCERALMLQKCFIDHKDLVIPDKYA